ncbi:MAG: hypothetical protein K0M48_04945 [Thiobacillus sp.]|nr:hypothetical protein [Thiobacillus sp.]
MAQHLNEKSAASLRGASSLALQGVGAVSAYPGNVFRRPADIVGTCNLHNCQCRKILHFPSQGMRQVFHDSTWSNDFSRFFKQWHGRCIL